jgi:hypothetical protein
MISRRSAIDDERHKSPGVAHRYQSMSVDAANDVWGLAGANAP